MPKFSVIVTAYNAEKYISRSVESLLNQKFTDFELIIVDDGSTDHTLEMCDQYANNDKRVRLIKQNNEGVSAARNIGIRDATGTYIQFVDADDVVNSDFLSNLSKKAQNNVDVVISDYKTLSANGELLPSYFHLQNDELIGYAATNGLLLNRLPNFAWAFCVRKDSYEQGKIKFPVGRIFEDNSVYYRLLFGVKKVIVSDNKDYHYFQRANSYVHVYSRNSINDLLVMLSEVQLFANNQGGTIQQSAQEFLLKRYFKAYTMCVVGHDNDDDSDLLLIVNKHIKQMFKYRPISTKLRLKKIFWRLGVLRPIVLYSDKHARV